MDRNAAIRTGNPIRSMVYSYAFPVIRPEFIGFLHQFRGGAGVSGCCSVHRMSALNSVADPPRESTPTVSTDPTSTNVPTTRKAPVCRFGKLADVGLIAFAIRNTRRCKRRRRRYIHRNRSAKVEPVVKNGLLVGEVGMKRTGCETTIGHWRKRKRTTTISNASQ